MSDKNGPGVITSLLPLVVWSIIPLIPAISICRRRMLRYKGAARPYKSESRPAYCAANPATRMIVGDWYIDELGNRARIIEGA
jgi:hypothetical protein